MGPLEAIWSNPLLKQGHPKQVDQDQVQVAFEDLQAGRLHSFSWQPVPLLSPLNSEKVFAGVQRETPMFQFLKVSTELRKDKDISCLLPSLLFCHIILKYVRLMEV